MAGEATGANIRKMTSGSGQCAPAHLLKEGLRMLGKVILSTCCDLAERYLSTPLFEGFTEADRVVESLES